MNGLDYAIARFLNSFVNRSALADFFIGFVSDSHLGRFFFQAAFVWLWFQEDEHQEENRKRCLAAGLGVLLTVIVARAASILLPFSRRPIHNASLLLTMPDRISRYRLDNWSSFPSDTAALCFAIGFGLLWINRPIGAAALAYATMVAFARLYLGLHYFSDVFAAAILACGSIYIVMRMRDWIGAILLPRLKHSPTWFYACAFLVLIQVASLFDGVREPLRELVGILRHL